MQAMNVSSVTGCYISPQTFPCHLIHCSVGKLRPLFWSSSALSGGVSSFGYGAARQGIFRCVYFEVITRRCFCRPDSMLLHPFILLSAWAPVLYCRNWRTSVSCEVFTRIFLWSFNLFAVGPFSLVYSRSLSPWPWYLPSSPSPQPLPVLFDINIVSGWVSSGAVHSSALLLLGYKQVSCGPCWPTC